MRVFSMRSLLLFLSLVCITLCAVHQLPMHKKPRRNILELRDRLYKKAFRNAVRNKKDDVFAAASSGILNYIGEVDFLVNVTVGTPRSQTFSVVVDLMSADFWVADKTCIADRDCQGCSGANCHHFDCDFACCDPNAPCRATQYDSSMSTTYKRDGRKFTISSQNSQTSGFLGFDILKVGDDPSPFAVNVTFGQTTSMTEYAEYDGVLGLAYASIADEGFTTPFAEAMKQGLVDQPLYTIYVESGDDGEKRTGLLTLGGHDNAHCNDILGFAPLTSATFFQFHIYTVSAGSYTNNKGWDAVLNLDDDLIPAPSDVVTAVVQNLVPNARLNDLGVYEVDCDAQFPDFDFEVGTMALRIQAHDMITSWGPNYCLLSLVPSDSTGFGPAWILGASAFRQYCMIFDMAAQQIGFSQPNH